jgi:hypothetical protein
MRRRRLLLLILVVSATPWLLMEGLYLSVLGTLPGYPEKPTIPAPTRVTTALWASMEHGLPQMARSSLWGFILGRPDRPGSAVSYAIAKDHIARLDLQREWSRSKVWRGGLRWNVTAAVLMVWVSQHWSVEEALSAWAVRANYGGDREGIEKAATYYFGKPAAALELDEAALLAAISYSPRLDPACHPDVAKQERDRILARMQDTGVLVETAIARAAERPLLVRPACSAPTQSPTR